MRGFLLGSIGLIALYVALQTGSADRISAGTDSVSKFVARLVSPNEAGVPQRGYKTGLNQVAPPATGGGGGGAPKPTDAPYLPGPGSPVISV